MIELIKIKIGEKQIELTKDEAMQLKSDLDGLFNYPSQWVIYPYYPTYPSYPTWGGVTTWSSASDYLTEEPPFLGYSQH